jgi:hypothetical protein
MKWGYRSAAIEAQVRSDCNDSGGEWLVVSDQWLVEEKIHFLLDKSPW